MAIWGNRDREPAAEEAPAEVAPAATPENGSPSGAAPGDGAPATNSAPPTGEPAPAPPVSESPGGTDAPAPVLAEDLVVIDSEAAVKDPALTETRREPAEPAAPDAAAGGISPQRWSEILVTFVDNPRGSVKMAADAVDSAIEEVVASVRARQRDLASSWQSGETDTEQLRVALREYRKFGAQVRQMSPAEPGRG